MEKIEQPIQELNGAQLGLNEGSMLGKFKDATSLLNAYNNLQAEFTRKSQKLKELEKTVEGAELLSPKESASQEQTIMQQTDVSENNTCSDSTKNQAELKVSEMLITYAKNHPEAVSDLDQIKQELIAFNLSDVPNGIEIAYRLAKEKRKSEPADLVNNTQFIQEYILSNSNITNMIIDEYIQSLANGKHAPKIMSGQSNAMVYTPNVNQPKTLAEANKIFSKMLEK